MVLNPRENSAPGTLPIFQAGIDFSLDIAFLQLSGKEPNSP